MLNQAVGTEFSASQSMSIAPSQRLHLILLGVADVQASARFYESLGWQRSPTGHEGFEKFDLGGYGLALIQRDALAEDLKLPVTPTPVLGSHALIYLAKTPEDVPQILARAVAAGGKLIKPATRTHWGVAGYFADLDGHLFEVDYEKTWVFNADHHLVVDVINT